MTQDAERDRLGAAGQRPRLRRHRRPNRLRRSQHRRRGGEHAPVGLGAQLHDRRERVERLRPTSRSRRRFRMPLARRAAGRRRRAPRRLPAPAPARRSRPPHASSSASPPACSIGALAVTAVEAVNRAVIAAQPPTPAPTAMLETVFNSLAFPRAKPGDAVVLGYRQGVVPTARVRHRQRRRRARSTRPSATTAPTAWSRWSSGRARRIGVRDVSGDRRAGPRAWRRPAHPARCTPSC